ncbi:DUF4142 domain-containing protein [Desertivirga xinjiangensis]|uniref:DUF4142 domain-containing protein n=1 Tax=Desertivirga xinjiangensis TaxID=539206 RepID=UPI00210DAFF0|nr:DUF4142 domain-containing protein [Pedobacter xinjiangensis]
MKKWSIAVMLLAGSILVQSCKDDDDDDFSMDRQMFVTQASSGNMLEIQAGQLAIEQGSHQEVKNYGQHMVTDHTAAGAELATLASAKNLSVSMQLMANHQQQFNVLTPLTGPAFDMAFADLMVKSHQEQVNLFDMASKEVNDADLRDFAREKLPVLKAHLEEAQELKVTVTP